MITRPRIQWRVEFSDAAKSQLKKLDKPIQQRILSFLEKRILNCDNPRSLGDALKGNLNPYWRYRVGDYRILCILENEIVTVHVMHVGHRREIYL
ncbi:MAG: type toxin-antitoxin system RelE/ParE family toxin [Alphaproteobacteria bacterium]|nr:type toxin-antitoxin system RelE/ParE family toxin [Alphaproteobacteria bacterium]